MLVLGSPIFTAGDMPIDTLFHQGSSPPLYSFLCSIQRIPLNRTRCGMQNSTSDNCHSLKPCLRNQDRPEEMAPAIEVIEVDVDNELIQKTSRLKIADRSRMAETASVCHASNSSILKKKVCFADSKGLLLATVRVMDGPSDAPPRLDINLFKDVIQNEQAKPNPPYTYVPDFEQPASNYLDFRERLEKNKVCLENLVIKDNITIMGTVKVRNISFEKSVRVRVTFDEWKSYRDVPATYVFHEQAGPEDSAAAAAGASTADKYDTFKFQFELPPNLGGKPTFFCLCYQCNQTGYWDNNKGINYRIISLQEKETSEHEKMVEHYSNLSSNYPWAETSFHSIDDIERPYW